MYIRKKIEKENIRKVESGRGYETVNSNHGAGNTNNAKNSGDREF